MPKSDFDGLRNFTKWYVRYCLRDGSRRDEVMDDIDDAVFDELVAEAEAFWAENGFVRRKGISKKTAALHFFRTRNEDDEGKAYWENPDVYGNYESAKLTERARKKGPHRLERIANGKLRIIRLKRR